MIKRPSFALAGGALAVAALATLLLKNVVAGPTNEVRPSDAVAARRPVAGSGSADLREILAQYLAALQPETGSASQGPSSHVSAR